jgi:2-polyprenyl-6-methoxyphenol hydroxylase-like FAD-dependent oxidoreductase
MARWRRLSRRDTGARPSVSLEEQGRVEEIHARLVVCADGRGSVARKWLNFPVQQESYGMLLAGVLCEATPDIPADTNHFFLFPGPGVFAFLCPRAITWNTRLCLTSVVRNTRSSTCPANQIPGCSEATPTGGAPSGCQSMYC